MREFFRGYATRVRYTKFDWVVAFVVGMQLGLGQYWVAATAFIIGVVISVWVRVR